MDEVKTINTPYNNAVALMNRANELLNENNINDSTGKEIAQLEITPANPAWLFALACGSLHTSWQRQLAKAYSALDPQSCENDQVLVLAALAGVKRGAGSPSHITIRISNMSSERVTIPVGTIFSETVTNNSWALNKNVILEPTGDVGSSYLTTVFCTKNGEVSLPSGTLFTVDGDFSVMAESTSKSGGGEYIETISSLRNRISQGVDANDHIKQAENAIGSIAGIETCSIWFNSGITEIMVGAKTLPGRTAYISVKGVDSGNLIASTYFKYLDVPAVVGEQTSDCMIGLQKMSVRFDYAKERVVDVYVFINKAGSEVGAVSMIKNAVAEHSASLACGENLTSQQVSEWVANAGFGAVIGCGVGTSDGKITDIQPDEYCVFTSESIHVMEYMSAE